jgi:hypothetical protein
LIGERIKVSPWNDQIRMLHAQPVALLYAREKMPFELAPFYFHLERVSTAKASATTMAKDPGKKP